jgi:hypothetical protein
MPLRDYEMLIRNEFIRRVCYDRANQYMLIRLNDSYYHYCELPQAVLNQFMEAPSMGSFTINIRMGKRWPV